MLNGMVASKAVVWGSAEPPQPDIPVALWGVGSTRSGHIIYITSMGGIVTFPGLGIYHGGKFALEPIGACSLEAYDLNPAKY
jgi:hypothetical protein